MTMRRALVVVDVQNDYFAGGKLCCSHRSLESGGKVSGGCIVGLLHDSQ